MMKKKKEKKPLILKTKEDYKKVGLTPLILDGEVVTLTIGCKKNCEMK
jgi:hypothetical protein